MSEGLAALRDVFDAAAVGKLPKGGIELDYVGHAAVTDRLLTVDPEWNWEPAAIGPDGNPALDKEGNLWIRLTVCDVTRLGVGDGATMKIRIGDALRNAAMRFGVALYLWTKDELESTAANPPARATRGKAQHSPAAPDLISDAQMRMLRALYVEKGIKQEDQKALVSNVARHEVASHKDLTRSEASTIIKLLQEMSDKEA